MFKLKMKKLGDGTIRITVRWNDWDYILEFNFRKEQIFNPKRYKGEGVPYGLEPEGDPTGGSYNE